MKIIPEPLFIIMAHASNLSCHLTPYFCVPCSSADIDECQDQRACPSNSTCVNNLGGFDCVCSAGYRYNKTKGTCEGEKYVVTSSFFYAASQFVAWRMPQLGQENVIELAPVLNTQPSLDKHGEQM